MKSRRLRFALAAGVVAVATPFLALTAGAGTTRSTDVNVVGAGSSFDAPLITAWYQYFNAHTAGVDVSYNSVGSGAGIAAITARTVDFGASDAPLTPDQATNCKECAQFPILLGTSAILYNVPGVAQQIKLTGPVIAGIYLGQVTNWNDPKIKALNPGVNLPDLKITPVYRSDGSGTSFNVTDYLSQVSPEFAGKIGKSTQPPFPVGVGARGSSGVSGVVNSTPGAVGYADVAYALANKLRFAKVRNRGGYWATPGIRGAVAAASTLRKIPPDNAISIVDPPVTKRNRLAYPISTFSWAIVPLASKNAKEVKQFFLFALSKQGQAMGTKLLYAPMPDAVRVAAVRTIAKIKQASN